MKRLYKSAVLFIFGGAFYLLIEVLWRTIMGSAPTHWAMFLVGGLSFVLIGGINEWISWELSLVKQSLIGTAVILLVELISGCILNLWLGLGIWDYSDKFLNVAGQICPQFAVGWFLLAGTAIVLDDYLRYWLFGEEKPHYQIISVKKRRKKKVEFSKILVAWALVLTTVCVVLSYALSFTDHDPTSDVTVAVASACIAIAVAYEAKSFGEKNSRNKYGVDRNGYKIEQDSDDDGAVG